MSALTRLVYEVDLFIDEEIADEFEQWLDGHLYDMLTIDGFEAAIAERRELLDADTEQLQRRICVRYSLRDRAALDHYVEKDAARMRADAVERFGGRFHAERSLLSELREPDAKPELYRRLSAELDALLEGERDLLANTANAAAHLFERLPRINWAGFYRLRGDELVLGPFQGKSACVRIALGKGVCGTAAKDRRSLIVDDVRAFEGHIACDPDSRSEIVIPLLHRGHLIGVFDIDSPLPGRFDDEDRRGLESFVSVLLDHTDLSAKAEQS